MLHYFVLVIALFASQHTLADSEPAQKIKTAITDNLNNLSANIPIDRIETTPVSGLSAVILTNGQTLYMSNDGQYIIEGHLLKIENNQIINVTLAAQAERAAEQLKNVKKEDMIIFSPKSEVKATIYAFTDVDCGYCRRLHKEMSALNEKGIEVRYLAFPRSGKAGSAYKKMVSAWCSDNPNEALSKLKNNQRITPATCDNPVEDQRSLGIELGITGTPAIFFENGQRLSGYRPAEDIAEMLGI